MRIRHLVPLAVLAAALALPASAPAAQTFGSDLTGTTFSNVGACGAAPGCTFVQYDNLAPGYRSPISGVIVRWRIKAGSANSPVRLRVLRSGAGFTGAGTSAEERTTTDVSTFPTRLPVQAGDSIGVDNATEALLLAQAASPAVVRVIQPPVADGATAGTNGALDQPNRALQINADVEADADGDGYGDETQDGCPGDAARQAPPCGTGPTNPDASPGRPAITDLRVVPARFRVDGRARIRFRLSEAAQWSLTFHRVRPGRRRGGRCVAESPRVRTGRRCTAYVRRGSRRSSSRAGLVSTLFRGRLAGRPLAPGVYRVTVAARDAEGLRARTRSVRFRLLPRAR